MTWSSVRGQSTAVWPKGMMYLILSVDTACRRRIDPRARLAPPGRNTLQAERWTRYADPWESSRTDDRAATFVTAGDQSPPNGRRPDLLIDSDLGFGHAK